jgi:superfamily II DNA or RNA helicase
MTQYQAEFMAMFENQLFGPRNSFEARDWQVECLEVYQSLVEAHKECFQENGHWMQQHRFTIYAGTGSGKTKAAAMLASYLLNAKKIDQVVIICPNRSILIKTRADFRKYFDIDLVTYRKARDRDGIRPKFQGCILCYGTLMNQPTTMREVCSYRRTLVIFDEVHHLGDEQKWGDSAVEAFGNVPFVLCLTGTPYRSDNVRIPFVTYEESERGGLFRFKADAESRTGFTYYLGRAVAEGVCRMPQFCWHKGTVEIRPVADGPTITTTFDDKVTDAEARWRLQGAVKYGSTPRLQMLREALEKCQQENRKAFIFLGGDTQGDQTPTVDAKDLLPDELKSLGFTEDEWAIVTSDDTNAHRIIEDFPSSGKRILISINMISEGTDLPENSACIFLTTVTSFLTTIQRIGRTLRSLGENDPHKTALIFMFRDPEYVRMADEMLEEIERERAIYKRKVEGGEGKDPKERPAARAEAIGVAGGEIQSVKFGANEWPIDLFQKTQGWLRSRGLPSTMLDAAMKLAMAEGASGGSDDSQF